MDKSNYRPEIDGLRAIAVYSVILFHAGFDRFSGGFVGVDVFFVISGFLITGIILEQHHRRSFSVLEFYERRARRILPALFLVLGLSTLAAWRVLHPSDMIEFGKSLLYVPAFLSNAFFARQSGYFDVASELKPLLHTWSLAVEEQFYIFFPMLLWAVFRLSPRRLTAVIFVCATVSFGYAHLVVRENPVSAFFLLPGRMWELMAGALLATMRAPKIDGVRFANLASMTGLSMIVVAVLFFDRGTPFPGVAALVPVMGSVLIIRYSMPGTIVHQVLAAKVPVKLGLISYSAYLFHQPVFAFFRLNSITSPGVWIYGALVAVITGLAWLSWRYVEQPFRDRSRVERKHIWAMTIAGSVLFICVGHFIKEHDGLPERFSASGRFERSLGTLPVRRECLADQPKITKDDGFCFVGDLSQIGNTERQIAVFGDSHSYALLPAFDMAARAAGYAVVHNGLGGCPPLVAADIAQGNYPPKACQRIAESFPQFVKGRGIKTVFLVGRWAFYTDGDYSGRKRDYWLTDNSGAELSITNARRVFEGSLLKTVRAYQDAGVEVYVVLQAPQQKVLPVRIYDRLFSTKPGDVSDENKLSLLREFSVSLDEHLRLQRFNRTVFERHAAVGLLNLVNMDDLLCSDTACLMGTPDVPYYADADHLSAVGAARMASLFSAILMQSSR